MNTSRSASSEPPPSGAENAASHGHHPQAFWLWVLCLTGVDYFSTLAYQPSIAIENAGRLAPFATFLLVLVTLFGAVPVYRRVARSSPHGQGSIAMLQKLVHGWAGKFLVLVLLGFAATDFVITITLSAADASEHLLHNPLFRDTPAWMHSQVGITLLLTLFLGALFLKGFREVIGIAVVIVAFYLVMNAIVLIGGMKTLISEPHYITEWATSLSRGDLGIESELSGKPLVWYSALFLSALLFPKLALGLSGFETGVAVMPLIKGTPQDTEELPTGRILGTQRLLLTSALIMSVMLIGSSFVVATLIPLEQLQHGGHAQNRALAWIAHGSDGQPLLPFFGPSFGTLYDISTITILWFAGASALSGLLNLIPRYLPRFGMAPDWVSATRPLVCVIVGVCLVVTILFQASVSAQGAAYATGVMVLILSACVAVIIERFQVSQRSGLRRVPWSTVVITFVFLFTTIDILIEKPDGLIIACCFIGAIIVVSLVSRFVRSDELRVVRFQFATPESRFRWNTLQHIEIPVLAPHRPGGRTLDEKERELREWHHLEDDIPVVFVEVSLGDPSDFFQEPMLDVQHQGGRYVIVVSHCTSIAPALAAMALSLSVTRPVELHFGWSDESPLKMNLGFLLFGEGNVPFLVRELLRDAQPDERLRPRVVIG